MQSTNVTEPTAHEQDLCDDQRSLDDACAHVIDAIGTWRTGGRGIEGLWALYDALVAADVEISSFDTVAERPIQPAGAKKAATDV